VRRTIALGLVLALAGTLASLAAAAPGQSESLVVYSGRAESFVKPMFDEFTRQTGISVQVRYGDSAALAATLLEEGNRTPADVFFAQDAGALGAVAAKGRLAVLPATTLNRVPRRFQAPGRRWVATSARARVAVYNTNELRASDLPASIWGYTAPRWKGKVGLPPTNASFQAMVSAMRMRAGDARTRDWLLAMKANDLKFYSGNTQVVAAVASGEVQVGLVNHYYLYQLKEQRPTAPIANGFLTGRDPGALINIAGMGITTSSKRKAAALRLVNFMLSQPAQRFFARSPGRAEYPLAARARPRPGLAPLTRIEGAGINLGGLGPQLARTLRLLSETGYTR
jgi:iron(III) transport system substrate-binding protein